MWVTPAELDAHHKASMLVLHTLQTDEHKPPQSRPLIFINPTKKVEEECLRKEQERAAAEELARKQMSERGALFSATYHGATVKEIKLTTDGSATIFFTDGRRFPEHSGFFLDGIQICHCPCRCGWTNEALGPTGVCQSCTEGHHEIPPEGVPFDIPELVKLLTSYTKQCEAEDERRRGIQKPKKVSIREMIWDEPERDPHCVGARLISELRAETENWAKSLFTVVTVELMLLNAHLERSDCDHWFAVSGKSDDGTFCVSVECDDTDVGLAGVWRAFKRHERIKAIAAALSTSMWAYNEEPYAQNVGTWTLSSNGQVVERIVLHHDGSLHPAAEFAVGTLLNACLAAGFKLVPPSPATPTESNEIAPT